MATRWALLILLTISLVCIGLICCDLSNLVETLDRLFNTGIGENALLTWMIFWGILVTILTEFHISYTLLAVVLVGILCTTIVFFYCVLFVSRRVYLAIVQLRGKDD